jgi:hypothetical protein
MNILTYKGWARINIFNLLGDFDGHWVFYVHLKTNKYLARKFGGYESLTSYTPVEGEFVKLSPEQEEFINDRLLKRFQENPPHGIEDEMWDNIYDDLRKELSELDKVDAGLLNQWRPNETKD